MIRTTILILLEIYHMQSPYHRLGLHCKPTQFRFRYVIIYIYLYDPCCIYLSFYLWQIHIHIHILTPLQFNIAVFQHTEYLTIISNFIFYFICYIDNEPPFWKLHSVSQLYVSTCLFLSSHIFILILSSNLSFFSSYPYTTHTYIFKLYTISIY